eukprot:878489-Rhodomonas_salina.1
MARLHTSLLGILLIGLLAQSLGSDQDGEWDACPGGVCSTGGGEADSQAHFDREREEQKEQLCRPVGHHAHTFREFF